MRRALVVALSLACGACIIGRDYVGNELHADPATMLHPGATTLAEVLQTFGAPDKIQRRHNGDILTYRYVRQNSAELRLQDPVVTGVTFFVYSKEQQKANRLTLFFDDKGVLSAYGFTGGVTELDPLLDPL
jgi:hypothetical protein